MLNAVQLEGTVRPTFFRGVATVVLKMLNITQPDVLYLGRKDYQQSVVVRRMIEDLCVPVELRVGPIVREADGLAMSSRNVYLSPAQRARATVLYEELRGLPQRLLAAPDDAALLAELQAARGRLQRGENAPGDDRVALQYLELTDQELQPITTVEHLQTCEEATVSGVVLVGSTRILDNVIVR